MTSADEKLLTRELGRRRVYIFVSVFLTFALGGLIREGRRHFPTCPRRIRHRDPIHHCTSPDFVMEKQKVACRAEKTTQHTNNPLRYRLDLQTLRFSGRSE